MADSGVAQTIGFGLQLRNQPDQTGFQEQAELTPGRIVQSVAELGAHARAEAAVAVPIVSWDRHRRLFAFSTDIDFSAVISTDE